MVILEKIPRKKVCLYLIGKTRRRVRPKFNILLRIFSLNPPDQKDYITHYEAMAIASLVDIFCATEYNYC